MSKQNKNNTNYNQNSSPNVAPNSQQNVPVANPNYPQQPTQNQHVAPKKSNSKMVGILIAAGVTPIVASAAAVAVLFGQKLADENTWKARVEEINKMKELLKNSQLDVVNKQNLYAADVNERTDIKFAKPLDGYKPFFTITKIDSENGLIKILVSITPIEDKGFHAVAEQTYTIGGFKILEKADANYPFYSALQTLKNEINSNKNSNGEIITKNYTNITIDKNFKYESLTVLCDDLAIDLGDYKKSLISIKNQEVYLNNKNNEIAGLEVTLLISNGNLKQEQNLRVAGFTTIKAREEQILNDAVKDLVGKTFKTTKFVGTKTYEEVKNDEYVNGNSIANDILELKTAIINCPGLSFSTPKFKSAENDGLNITLFAHLGQSVKEINFNVDGFKTLSTYYTDYLQKFADAIPNEVKIPLYKSIQPSPKLVKDVVIPTDIPNFFNDYIDNDIHEYAKIFGINLKIESNSEYNLAAGTRTVKLVLSKGGNSITKNILLTGFLNPENYAKEIIKKMITEERFPKHHSTKNFTKKLPNQVTYAPLNLEELGNDIGFDLKAIEKRWGVKFNFAFEKDDLDKGTKTFNFKILHGSYGEPYKMTIYGFKTQKEADYEKLNEFLKLVNDNQVTKNNASSLSNNVSYTNFSEFDADLNDAITPIAKRYRELSIEQNIEVVDFDSKKCVKFFVNYKGLRAEKIVYVSGFTSASSATNKEISDVIENLNNEYFQSNLNASQTLPSEYAKNWSTNFANAKAIDDAAGTNLVDGIETQGIKVTTKGATYDNVNGKLTLVLGFTKNAVTVHRNLTIINYGTYQKQIDAATTGWSAELRADGLTMASENTYNDLGDIYAIDPTFKSTWKIENESLATFMEVDNRDWEGDKYVHVVLQSGHLQKIVLVRISRYSFQTSRYSEPIKTILKNINTIFTTVNNADKYITEVFYHSTDELINDVDPQFKNDLDANGLAIKDMSFKYSFLNNNELRYDVTFYLKSDPNYYYRQEIVVKGFNQDNTKREMQILNEFKTLATAPIKTIFHNYQKPTEVEYKNINEMIADGGNLLKHLANKAVGKFNAGDLININLDESQPITKNDADGTITFYIKAHYRSQTISLPIVYNGFVDQNSVVPIERNLLAYAQKIQIKVQNAGEIVEGFYTEKLPDQILETDILFRDENGNQIDNAKYQVQLVKITPDNDNLSLNVTFVTSTVYQGKTLKTPEITKQIRTTNAAPAAAEIEKVWKATKWGVLKDNVPIIYLGELNPNNPNVKNNALHISFTEQGKTPKFLGTEADFVDFVGIKPGMEITFSNWEYLTGDKEIVRQVISEKKTLSAKEEGNALVYYDYITVNKKLQADTKFGQRNSTLIHNRKAPADVQFNWANNTKQRIKVNVRFSYKGVVVWKTLISGIGLIDGGLHSQYAGAKDSHTTNPAIIYYPFYEMTNNSVGSEYIDGK
ncbi:Uncharacterised protein [Mycoplasmopsis californica]|uniref:Lipoprotein 17-related variable surface protein n=1 Tax=Mycoplasmopsis equigenitalium TaxID=114883 RepID=A0ABY5J272_9BACT|nr:lipoprotein 17-related variable surface protein [Mycoplasmopsis equigenitalium]UUD36873.1 lipoprotein 17-related variable surface protein [Mycoplasmopsis equigenitalium]VEU69832.1 Uncharacterised protein [Mycoplasmopsis californica]